MQEGWSRLAGQDCRDVVDVVIKEMVGGVPIRILALDDDWDSCPRCDGKEEQIDTT